MAKSKTEGWEVAARRTREGERTVLSTLGGDFWFCPVKYSVEGAAAIQQVYMSMKDNLPEGVTKKLMAGSAEGKSQKDILSDFTEEELGAFLKSIDLRKTAGPEIKRLKLRYGFGKNNLFGNGDLGASGDRGELTEEVLDKLMLYPDTVDEALAAIEAQNIPLAKRRPEV